MEKSAAELIDKRKIVDAADVGHSPRTIHQIDPWALKSLFRRIIVSLGMALLHEEKCREWLYRCPCDTEGNKRCIRRVADTLSWFAVVAAQKEIQKKIGQFGLGHLTHGSPSRTQNLKKYEDGWRHNHGSDVGDINFPTYISHLIASMGPILQHIGPTNRLHVPVLDMTDVLDCRPLTLDYDCTSTWVWNVDGLLDTMSLSYLHEKGTNKTSSGWWLFRPNRLGESTVKDPLDCSEFLGTFDVFSPLGFDAVEHHLKLGLLYAQEPLVEYGIGPFSTSPWFDFGVQAGEAPWPREDEFPEEAHHPPYFWEGASARLAVVERCTVDKREPLDDPPHQHHEQDNDCEIPAKRVKCSHNRTIAIPGRTQATNCRPTSDRPLAAYEHHEFRIKYFYFDYKALDRVTPGEYMDWIKKMHINCNKAAML